MGRVELGVSFMSEVWDGQTSRLARYCEDLGFDCLTCGEHLMFHGVVPNSLIALAVAAGATERIRLMSSVVVLPLYPPALAAKLAAELDVLSNGRFELGVGIGGEFPKEFEAVGVPVSERGARTNEGLEIVSRLLSEESVSFSGRFNSFTDVSIEPRPVQKPRPPIWVAGRKEPAMRRAARYADGWMPYMYTPQQVGESKEKVQRLAEEAGRSGQDIKAAIYIFLTSYPDREKARRVAIDCVGRNYQQDFSRLVDKYVITGTPADCRVRIKEFVDAGTDRLVLAMACPREDMEAMMRLTAEEVLPEFR